MRMPAATAAILLVCLGPVGFAQQPAPERAVPREQQDAGQFLHAVYPELRDSALWVEMATSPGGLRFRVVSPLVAPLPAPAETPVALLFADFTYAKDLALTTFRASGPFLQSTENLKLRARLRASRDPGAALSDERTRFGIQSGATMVSEAPIEALARTLGVMSVGGASLKSVAGDADSAYGAVWEMAVVARKASGTDASYALQFEPYGGRLVGLKRQ